MTAPEPRLTMVSRLAHQRLLWQSISMYFGENNPAAPWPSVDPEDAWLFDAFEESIAGGNRSPDQLRQRARELRQQAADHGDLKGMHDAGLATAARYEAAAAARD